MTEVRTVNGKTIETGLSPSQTAGNVGGQTVYRDPSSDITKTYTQAESIQTTSGYPGGRVLVEINGQRYYVNPNEVPEIGSYRRETGFTSVRRTAYTPAEIEQQYRQQKGLEPAPIVPSPLQLGYTTPSGGYAPFVSQGGIYQALEQRPQQQYPYTPIDYWQQQRAEQYYANLTPFQRGVGLVGASLVDVRGVAGSYIQSKLFEPSESGYKERIYELAPRGEYKTISGAGYFALRGLTGEVSITGLSAFGLGYGLSALKLSPTVLKGLGYGAVGLQTYETGKSVYEGRYGEAITETGMFAASLPFVQAGYATKLPISKMFGTSAASRAAIADYNIQVREGLSSVKPQELRLIDVESHNILVGERASYAPRTTIQKMFGGEQTPYQAAGKQLSISARMFGQSVRAQPELRVLGEQFHNIDVMERLPFEPRTPAMIKMFGRPAQLPAGLEIKGLEFHNIDVMERVPSSAKSLSISQKMFGRTEFIKPQKVSVLDIMLVRPQPMYKQVTRSQFQTGFRTRSGLTRSYVSDIRRGRAGTFIGITSGLRQDTGAAITPTLASRHISKTRTELMTGNILRLSPAAIQRVSPVQSSASIQQYTPIQAYEQAQKQISRETQRTRQRTPILSRGAFPEMNLKKLKFPSSSINIFPGMRKRKGRISSFKFPEISRVASPRDIMKGFKSMFAATSPSKKTTKRKGRKGKR